MYSAPPVGITPPTPGLEHEEPEFAIEEDIPVEDDSGQAEVRRDIDDVTPDGDGPREVERE